MVRGLPLAITGDGASRRLFVCGLVGLPALAHAKSWSDPHTGLGLSGYDPVSYYEEGGPFVGKGEFESPHDKAFWRFINTGNKQAFDKNPALYAPQFGGYDPVLLGERRATAGHPLLWRTYRDRLYVFFSNRQTETFDADPDTIIATAARNWPQVQKDLT